MPFSALHAPRGRGNPCSPDFVITKSGGQSPGLSETAQSGYKSAEGKSRVELARSGRQSTIGRELTWLRALATPDPCACHPCTAANPMQTTMAAAAPSTALRKLCITILLAPDSWKDLHGDCKKTVTKFTFPCL